MFIPEHIQEEYPFPQHSFGIDGRNLNFVDVGRGHPVVMFHGNPTWSFYYRNVIKQLSDNNRCLALDNMGCGFSDKPQDYNYTLEQHVKNAVAWLESLNLESFDLIVHDWGGAIGMGVARLLAEKVRRIVILNTAAFYVDRIPISIGICRWPIIGEWIVRGFNGFAFPALKMAVEKPLSKAVKNGFVLPYNNWHNRIATHRFVKDIPANDKHPTFGYLQQIEDGLSKFTDRNILLAWGMKDFCFTPQFLERWKKIYPKAQVIEYGKAGHYVLEDEKDTLIPEIKGFLS